MNNLIDESIIIIDYGVGNLGSVANMLKKIGARNVIISSDADKIEASKKVLLPGVGSFDYGMSRLNKLGISSAIKNLVKQDDTLLMGICLGMQLLTDSSEEGSIPGLGLVPGSAKLFPKVKGLKVPHMGWNMISPRKPSFLFRDMPLESRFYFVHSYFVDCINKEDVLCTTRYGEEFVSSFQRRNIIGCQFHPEKSHRFGMQLFKNFVNFKGSS